MYLEIVSPEATWFAGAVTSVAVPGVDGEFQMLENHAPIVSLLQKGKVKIKGNVSIDEAFQHKFTQGPNGEVLLPISSGTVELNNNTVTVLVD